MTREGMRICTKFGNPLPGFTAYKIYTVIAGTGEANLSATAQRFGLLIHNENTANVRDDNGNIRFITMQYFREFRLDCGVLFHE